MTLRTDDTVHFSKWFSFSINCLFFALICILTKPVYASDDDTYILYLLGGGFGNAPTALLHYNHIMHPLLGMIIRYLFTVSANINWYSCFLFAGNFVACSIILNLLVGKLGIKKAIILYILLFGVFEGPILLQLNLTGTAMLLGIAGIALLMESVRDHEQHTGRIVTGIFILVFASLFRVHVLIPLAGVSLPFLFLSASSKRPGWVLAAFFVAAIAILLLNYFQYNYYRTHIPGWVQEEAYRQAFFYYVNHPVHVDSSGVPANWKIETGLLQRGLLIDSSWLCEQKIQAITAAYRRHFPAKDFLFSNKWFFINNRLYLYGILVIGLVCRLKGRNLALACLSLLLCLCGSVYLALYEKLPAYLFPALLFLVAVLMALSVNSTGYRPSPFVKTVRGVFFLSVVVWSLIRLYKINLFNEKQNNYCKIACRELRTKPDTLFVITDDAFPLNYFYVWDLPKNYQLTNILYKENLLNNTYQNVLLHFGIDDLRRLPEKSNVLFWGKRSAELEEYYRQRSNKPVIVSGPLPGFADSVYRIGYESR